LETEYSNSKKAIIFIGAIFILLSQTLSSQGINTLQSAILTKFNAMSYFAYLSLLASIGMALTVPIGGKLADLFGKKILLWIGASIVCISSIITSQAPTLFTFLLFRALIPVGQGITMVVPFAVLAGVFLGKQRNMAYGCLSAALAIGYFLGGTVGGWLADINMLWLAIAYPGVLCFIGAVMIAVCITNQKAEGKIYIDYPGIIFLAITLIALIYGASFGNKLGWGNPTILAALAIFVIALIVFVIIERKSKSPLIPIFMFRNPKVVGVLAITFFTVFYQISMAVYAPLLIQKVMGMSNAASGSVMVTRSITNIIFPALIAAWLIKKLDTRLWQVLFACGLMIAGAFLMIGFTTPQTSLTLFFVSFALLGIAESCKSTTITPFIQSVVEMKDMGAATALNSFFGVLAGTVSGAVIGIIYNTLVPDPQNIALLNSGINTIFLVTAASGAVVMLLALFVVRGKKQDSVSDNSQPQAPNH
jgi:MFS family permease